VSHHWTVVNRCLKPYFNQNPWDRQRIDDWNAGVWALATALEEIVTGAVVEPIPAVREVERELMAAQGKFGSMRGPHEGYAVILEELDELWDEVKAHDHDKAKMRAEARQVAAMAIRFMVDVTEKSDA
jgi:hypothetical protein